MTRPVALACLALAAALLAPAPASAVSSRAQQTYSCENAPDDGVTGSRPDIFQLGMTLETPASVAPGGTISLRGTADVRLPETYRQAIRYFDVKQIDIVSDTLSATVTIGSETIAQPADRWSSGPQQVGNPVVLTAPISFPTFRVPEGATGSVRIALPGNGFARTDFPGKTPAEVAFNARATARGPIGYPFKASCFLSGAEPNVIATIPIAAPSRGGDAAGAPAAPGSSSKGSRSRRGSSGKSAAGGTGSAASTPSSSRSSGAPKKAKATPFSAAATTRSGASAADPEAVDAAPESGAPGVVAAAAAGSTTEGVRLSHTWLWVLGLALCGGCVTWAVVSRLRLKALLDAEDR